MQIVASQSASLHLKMTTAPDERAGAHHHQADENLQNDACNGGGAFDPANPRTDGEKILPQLVRAIILRHTGYERERDIKKYSLLKCCLCDYVTRP